METKYSSCRQDHPANSISCDVYKEEKCDLLEVMKIVGSYIGEKSCAFVGRRMDRSDKAIKRTNIELL